MDQSKNKQEMDPQKHPSQTKPSDDAAPKQTDPHPLDNNETKDKSPQIEGDSESDQTGADKIISLKTFMTDVQHQQQLECQLQEKLENKESRVNRCTYNERPKSESGCEEGQEEKGYLYQQVYSCRTCYEEQIKEKLEGSLDINDPLFEESKKFKAMSKEQQDSHLEKIENDEIKSKYSIKPHGFCLGCMVNCHDQHEVNELYCKLQFRCDCGNSHMPETCQLNNEKEYENPKNRYTRNYYDLYCHCNMPHNQKLIDEQQVFMIQCFMCEDWYHNNHLNPMGRAENPKLPGSEINEKYLLICRTCIHNKGPQFKDVLMRNQNYFYDIILKYVQSINSSASEEPPIQKIQKISSEPVPIEQAPPKKIDELSTLQELDKDMHPLDIDILIDDAFLVDLSDEEKIMFKEINQMIQAMNNVDEEDVQLQKNLDGEIDDTAEKDSEATTPQKGEINQQSVPKQQSAGSKELYEQYFTTIMSQTLQKLNVQQQPAPVAGTLKTGVQSDMNSMAQASLSLLQAQTQIDSKIKNMAQGQGRQIQPESIPIIMKNVASFKEKFITLLKDAEQTGEIITKEKVDEFFKDLKKQTGP